MTPKSHILSTYKLLIISLNVWFWQVIKQEKTNRSHSIAMPYFLYTFWTDPDMNPRFVTNSLLGH